VVKDTISKITAGCIFIPFWFIAGPLMAPFWILVVIVGALLQVFEWKETPKKLRELIMVHWFWF
jgi:hypothetical protein